MQFDEKKVNIISKSMDMMVENGIAKTRFSNIADLCEISRPTLYQYFPNKNELFLFAIEYCLSKMQDVWIDIRKRSDLGSFEKLKKILDDSSLMIKENQKKFSVFFDFVQRHQRKKGNFIAEVSSSYIRNSQNILEQILVKGVKDKELKPCDTLGLPSMFFSMILAYHLQLITCKGSPLVETSYKTIENIMKLLVLDPKVAEKAT